MTAIKERPILFSGPMVRAILEGRKTVTRRVMKPQPTAVNVDDERGGHWWPSEEHQSMLHIEEEMQKWTGLAGHACPYGEPGHLLRVSTEILLEITDVRVERLQEGEGETAFESRYVAEGIHRIHHGDGEHYYHPFKNEPGPGNWGDPFDAWRELWVSIKGGDSWNSNPWVWVVEFKRIEQ